MINLSKKPAPLKKIRLVNEFVPPEQQLFSASIFHTFLLSFFSNSFSRRDRHKKRHGALTTCSTGVFLSIDALREKSR